MVPKFKGTEKKTAITNFDIFVRTRSACSLGSFFKGNPNSNNYTAKWTPLQFKRLPVFLFDQIDHFRGCPEETEKMCKQTGHLERYDSLFSHNAKSWNISCIISFISIQLCSSFAFQYSKFKFSSSSHRTLSYAWSMLKYFCWYQI